MSIEISEIDNYTNYSDLLTKRANNVYFLNVLDISGYVFEISSFDVSSTIQFDPTFDTAIQQGLGFDDVSSIAIIDVSLSQFNSLFSLQSDSDDLDDLSINDLKYGFNVDSYNIFNDISFSNSIVIEKMINAYYEDQSLYYDFVRNLAYQITGGYAAADIFTNEEDLVQGVKDMDFEFKNLFNTLINELVIDTNGATFASVPEYNYSDVQTIEDLGNSLSLSDRNKAAVYKAAIALFTINSNDPVRLLTLLDDINTASAEQERITSSLTYQLICLSASLSSAQLTTTNIITDGGNEYFGFDNIVGYDETIRYGLAVGTYRINIPTGYAIAVLNIGKTNITYSGQTLVTTSTIIGTTADGTYQFYNGTVTINVLGDFGNVSIYGYNVSTQTTGYMGGRSLFIYSESCLNNGGSSYTIMETASTNTIVIPIRFHAGDKIALRLTYKPLNNQPLGNNVIQPRSYKLLLNLVE